MDSGEFPGADLALAMGNLSGKVVVAPNEGQCSAETMKSKLDLDRPSSPETLEKPLGLQVEEGTVTAALVATAPGVAHPPSTPKQLQANVEPSQTDLAVGDLVYAQVPSHPYWPAVITRDPETDVPFRIFGRFEQWHVHFLGCNGIRAWISKGHMFPYNQEVFDKKKSEFLDCGLMRMTKTKKQMVRAKKKGFIIAPHSVAPWNSANNEAESLLSVSRADRLEYLSDSASKSQLAPRLSVAPSDEVVQPAKKPKLSETSTPRTKIRRLTPKASKTDNLVNTCRLIKPQDGIRPKVVSKVAPATRIEPEDSSVNGSPSSSGSGHTPEISKRKRKTAMKSLDHSSPVIANSPLAKEEVVGTSIKKRGRPRKPLSTSPLEKRKPGRPRKNSLPLMGSSDLISHKEVTHSSKNDSRSLETSGDNSPSTIHRKKIKNSTKSPELRQTKLNFKPLPVGAKPKNGEVEAIVNGQSMPELVKGSKKKSLAAAGRQDSSGGVSKETSVSSSSRKKINLFSGYKDIKLCTICLKEDNVVKCRGPCSLYMHVNCADKYRFESPAKLFGFHKLGRKSKGRYEREKRFARNDDLVKIPSEASNTYDSADKDNLSENLMPKGEEAPQPSESDCSPSADASSNNELKDPKCNGHIDQANEDDGLDLHLSVTPNDLDSLESPGLPTPPADSPSNLDAAFDGENEPSSTYVTNHKSLFDAGKMARKEGKEKGWWCNMCSEGILGPCLVCGQDSGNRYRCKTGQCGKVFHLECLKEWPQKSVQISATGKTTLICPAHECHTCISGNPAALFSQSNFNSKLVKCLRCPATYHQSDHCLPAGVQILSSTQIICPSHYTFNRPIASVNWCCLCSSGGFLILCDRCPNAFHAHCLSLDSPPEGKFICEECETGRFPLYGEVVWAKCGSCKWWPARVMYPHEYTPMLMNADHYPGDFAVKFFGSNDYYWVFRGRAFSYHEGDAKKSEVQLNKSKTLSRYEELFYIGVQEANEAFINWSMEHSHHEQTWRPKMKPPLYKKITSNKPIGNVKLNDLALPETLSFCECKPESEDPCGPSTNCLNRILFVECTPDICNVGDKCRNRNFERKSYPKLMPFYTDSKGWGLKTTEPIKEGDFIIEYVGEVIDETEYKRRLALMEENKDENYYFLTLDKEKMLDAGPRGNLARFMNHSCQPNCLTEKWTVGLQTRVGIFAVEDIQPNTELVFNYNFTRTELIQKECRCGAPNCAGFIGAKPLKLPRPSTKTDSNGKAARRNGKSRKRKRSPSVSSQKSAGGVLAPEGLAITLKKTSNETNPSPVALEMDCNCFICGNAEPQLDCWHNTCTRTFHLKCVGLLDFPPTKRWLCPSHYCRICNKDYLVEKCSLCINSYCSAHLEGNIFIRRGKQPKCAIHAQTGILPDVVVKMEDEDNTEVPEDKILRQDDCDQKQDADDIIPFEDVPTPIE